MTPTVPNPQIDTYLAEGCGRCSLGGTPQCKAVRWQTEMALLRHLVLDCGLTEELKWGVPCYTLGGKNVALIHGFKDYCGLMFFKGALLADSHQVLVQQTPNVQAGRQIRFQSAQEVAAMAPVLRAYVLEAMALEANGQQVTYKKTAEYDMPDELATRLAGDLELATAFGALTPGRQRGYILHIAGAKQAKTRMDRIEKCRPQILAGKGLHD